MRWIIAGIMALGIVLAVASGWTERWAMLWTGLGIALLFGFILTGIYAIEDKKRDLLSQQLDEAKEWREGLGNEHPNL